MQVDKSIPRRASNLPTVRNKERLEKLVSLPKHRYGTQKYDGDPSKRTVSTLTVEDATNFKNMNYMATLRPDRSFSDF